MCWPNLSTAGKTCLPLLILSVLFCPCHYENPKNTYSEQPTAICVFLSSHCAFLFLLSYLALMFLDCWDCISHIFSHFFLLLHCQLGELILHAWRDTHKISRLLVPFRSGNSRIWVAPLSELQLKRNNIVSEPPPLLSLSYFSTRVCTQSLSNSSFHSSDSSSKINRGCFGCLTGHHKSHHSAFSSNALFYHISA